MTCEGPRLVTTNAFAIDVPAKRSTKHFVVGDIIAPCTSHTRQQVQSQLTKSRLG